MSDPAREYKRLTVECRELLVRLDLALHNHEARAAQNPTYWTFPGDLGKARRDLLELASFLGDVEAREQLHSEGEGR